MCDAPAIAPVLVAGVGNPERSDDGAGIEVARAVRRAGLPGVEVVEIVADVARLLAALPGRDTVLIVDAAVSGAAAGTVHRLDATDLGTFRRHGLSSHGFGVAEAVALAGVSGRSPRRIEVLAIEGASFRVGTERTPSVERACREVAREIEVRLGGRR